METAVSVWPERYDQEMDPRRRLALLEEALQNGEVSTEEATLRRRIWNLRYGEAKGGGMPPDGYLGLWVAMGYRRKDGKSPFRRNAAIRELKGTLEKLGIAVREGGLEQELVIQELVHMMVLYLTTCAEGNYATRFLGMVKLDQERLVQKVLSELYEVAWLLPEQLGMEEAFAPLRQAARSALGQVYPGALPELDRMISGQS